jgi:hypothetical protein
MDWLHRGIGLVKLHLGLEWLRETHSRLLGDDRRCLMTAAHMAGIGWMLNQVEGAAGFGALLSKIAGANDYTLDALPYAIVELQGICLVDSAAPGSKIVYEPDPPDRSTVRIADASFAWPSGSTLYLEVARRTTTKKDGIVEASLRVVSDACHGMVPPGFAAQVHLAREATKDDANEIAATLLTESTWRCSRTQLPRGMGCLTVSASQDGSIQLIGRSGGEEYLGSRLWSPREFESPGALVVSMESSDDAIEKKALDEASQLPAAYPGIVLIHRQQGTRGSATWINRLRNEFASVPHARPSGVWTFFRNECQCPVGSTMPYVLAGTVNPKAERPLPDAVAEGMRAMADHDAERWAALHPAEL